MHEKQLNTDSNSIKFNFDDFDIESFELKPINRGLGFHKPEERVRPKSTLPKSETPRVNALITQPPRPAARSSSIKNQIIASDLESMKPAFLKNEVAPPVTEHKITIMQRASVLERLMAFTVDIMLILLMMLGTGIILAFALEQPINFQTLQSFLGTVQFNLACLGVFSVLYVLYFGVLDMHSSFGKELFSLTVRNVSQKNLAFTQTLLRTFISLLSFIALGLPSVLDFHSRLTDSCVFKVEK